MEVFKDLRIKGSPESLEQFIRECAKAGSGDWSRDLQIEDQLEKGYAFRRAAGEGFREAIIVLIPQNDCLEAGNIVPADDSGRLTRRQYNALLDDFVAQIAGPTADRLRMDLEVTPDHRPISDWLAPSTAECLRTFAEMANKGRGSAHPADFDRWAAFLIRAHRDGARLDSGTLQRWLVEEEGWPEDTAHDLAFEFQFARDLLRAYDRQKA